MSGTRADSAWSQACHKPTCHAAAVGTRRTIPWPWIAALGGSSVAAIALALPWGASGRRWRSAYALIRLARELDIADGALAGTFAACVALTPVLAAAAWVAAVVRWRRSTQALTAAVGRHPHPRHFVRGCAVTSAPRRTDSPSAVAAGVVTLVGVGTLRGR